MTRIEFVAFLEEFRKDLKKNSSDWTNTNLEDFLEAVQAYTAEIQGYYDNMGMNINADNPTWENFSQILMAATNYE